METHARVQGDNLDEKREGITNIKPLLRLQNISKSFGPVQALSDITLDIYPGSVCGLVGDNGAGKSTLIKIIAGIIPPDSGDIIWENKKVHLHSPRDAADLGIATVYQDLALCENLDVVQNMFLGREEKRRIFLDEISMEKKTLSTLASLGVTTVNSVRQLVASLSGGQRQAVAVARAVMTNVKLVLMDEPTAALGVTQTKQVLDLVRKLAQNGIAVVFISHNLNHVFEVADRIAVLFHGRLVAEGSIKELDTKLVVEYMSTGTVQPQGNDIVRMPDSSTQPNEG